MPRSLEKIGDHLRKARVERGLEQKDLANILGVTESCIWLWENHRSAPPVPRCKGVIDFLGYDPFPKPETFSEHLVSFRRLKGLRVKDAATLVKVDPATWSSWERSEHKITGAYRARITSLLLIPADTSCAASDYAQSALSKECCHSIF